VQCALDVSRQGRKIELILHIGIIDLVGVSCAMITGLRRLGDGDGATRHHFAQLGRVEEIIQCISNSGNRTMHSQIWMFVWSAVKHALKHMVRSAVRLELHFNCFSSSVHIA
jgi:hypothetical protein